MEMKTEEIYVFALLQEFDELVELVIGDSELVFIKSGSDIFMSMGIDVWIDSD